MNESSSEMILYIGGSNVSLWSGEERIAVRSLSTGDLPQSLHERRARLMLRTRELTQGNREIMKRAGTLSVVVGSPWVTYHTRVIEHAREKPFIFSREIEETLVREDYALIKKEIERSHGLHDDVVLGFQIQAHILNGHQVHRPFGVATNRCTLPVVVAFGQRSIAHEILSFLELMLQRDDVSIRSHWQWMASEYMDQKVIVCIVGSITTDVMWIQEGILQYTTSLPCGYEIFTHEQAHAPHLLSFAQQAQHTDQWSRECSKILHEWSAHNVLPDTVEFITDNKDALTYIELLADEVRTLPFFTTSPDVVIPQAGEVFSDI